MASIFTYKKQISLKNEFDDIFVSIRKLKIEVGNHSYHNVSVNDKFAFIPKADSFLAGNALIPSVNATVDKREREIKVNFEFILTPFVRTFSVLFALFAAVLGIVGIIASVQSGTFNEGLAVIAGIVLFECLLLRVGLILNAKRFISEFLYELTGK